MWTLKNWSVIAFFHHFHVLSVAMLFWHPVSLEPLKSPYLSSLRWDTFPYRKVQQNYLLWGFMLLPVLLEHKFTSIPSLLPSVQFAESCFPAAACKWKGNNPGKVILQAWPPHRGKFPGRINFLVLFLLVEQDSFSNRLSPSHTEMQVNVFGRPIKLVFH